MFLQDFFYLSRADRRVVLLLCSLILIGIALVGGLSLTDDTDSYDTSKEDLAADNISRYRKSHNNGRAYDKTTDDETRTPQKLFYFDPNTATTEQLLSLGLKPWQIRNISKYRAKGGTYRCKEDFAYVYGLTVKEYKRLAPYIRISEDYRPASSLAEVRNHKEYSSTNRHEQQYTYEKDSKSSYTPKIHLGEYIHVNGADTTELMRIPGIGSFYSRQIVRYRDRLGGFVSKEQLMEIDGFPEDAIKYITIDTENIHKLQINRLSISQLKRHPYINYYQARAITDYRRLKGEIASLSQLKLMKEFSPNDIKRIEPYIEY